MTTTVNVDELNELAGSHRDGYTSEDVNETSTRVFDALGYDWAVIWDYYDSYGTGGHSEEFLRDRDGLFYAMPAFLTSLLFEGTKVSVETVEAEMATLTPLKAGPDAVDVEKLIEIDDANYALQVTTGDGKHL